MVRFNAVQEEARPFWAAINYNARGGGCQGAGRAGFRFALSRSTGLREEPF